MRKRIRSWAIVFACAASCCSNVFADEDTKRASLTIGSKAPSLDIEHWISNGSGSFEPVNDFKSDRVYIVEFWATWCGPCIGSMPHLAEIQKKYAGKNVQVIGISDEKLPTVQEFLKRGVGDPKNTLTYGELTSAYALTTDPDRSVYRDYMEAANLVGIPRSFIVGKSGLIEWIGHPTKIDEPLQQIVEGAWNREAFLAKFNAEQELEKLWANVNTLMSENKDDEALQVIAKKRSEAKDDAAMAGVLDKLIIQVHCAVTVRRVAKGADVQAALAELDAMSGNGTPEQRDEIELAKCQLLLTIAILRGEHIDQAVTALNKVAAIKDVDPIRLYMFAQLTSNSSQYNNAFPKDLINAATKIAERVVKEVPDRSQFINTLAILVRAQGDLGRAIELQTAAVEKSDADSKYELEQFLEKLKAEKGSADTKR